MLSLVRAGQGKEPQDGLCQDAGEESRRSRKAGLMQEEGWKQALDCAPEPSLLTF